MKKNIFLTSLIIATILSTFNIVSASERQTINEGETLNISDMTFENINYEGFGGAVENYGTLDIENSSFNSNSALNGGAIFNKSTINLINSSTFDGNTIQATETQSVQMKSGWTYDRKTNVLTGIIDGETVEVSALTVPDGDNLNLIYNDEIVGVIYINGRGGAIYNDQGDLTVNSSNFINNNALIEYKNAYDYSYDDNGITITNKGETTSHDGYGGAIYSKGNLNITDSTFENNKAAYGGAIYNDGNESIANIKNSKFINNTSYNEDSEQGSLTVGDETYTWNNEHYGLGSGGAVVTYGETNIEDSEFIGNTTGGDGGAVYTNGNLTVKNSFFKDNVAKVHNTGTYYTYQDGEVKKNDYDNDDGYGGAISHGGENLLVENSVFENNIAGGEGGGAISSGGKIQITGSRFTSNSSTGTGGSIDGKNELIVTSSNFDKNSAAYGGAIKNKGTTKITESVFSNNTSSVLHTNDVTYNLNEQDYIANNKSYSGEGGALNIVGDLNIENSTFDGNIAAEKGGAIFNVGNNIVVKNSTFTNNIAKSETVNGEYILNESSEIEYADNTQTKGAGGAIFAYGDNYYGIYTDPNSGIVTRTPETPNNSPLVPSMNSKLTVENSTFENNIAGDEGGGAVLSQVNTQITDSVFKENQTTGSGGAVALTGLGLNITDTDFINNTAQSGGAVSAKVGEEMGDIIDTLEDLGIHAGVHITAKNKDVTFSGNTAEKGSDIYLENQKLYINANENKTISFNGGIVGKNSAININDQTRQLYDDITSTGKIVIDNFVSPDENSTLPVNLKGGTLQLTEEKYLDGTDLTLAEGSTLDLMNDKVGTMNLNSLTSDNGNLKMDMDLSNAEQKFDFISAKSGSGNINISGINVLSDMDEGTNNISVNLTENGLPETITIGTSEKEINTITNDYLYTITSDGSKINVNRLTEDDGKAAVIDGFTAAINQNDTISGHKVNLSDNRVYSANRDIEITANHSERGWTGELGGKSLIINGNGRSLNGYDKKGIIISNAQTLTLNDTNIKGFKTSDDRKGALTVNDGGILNINAANYDVVVGGVLADKKADANAIYLDGTSSKAFLTTSNSRSITVDNDIRSSNMSNELNLNGDGKITFNGLVDPVTLNNENAYTDHNNYIDGVKYNLNSGVVSFSKDNYLNGPNNKNILNFNGGTLNIANGAVSTIDLAGLNINANSNIMLDADLASQTMDRITADSVTAKTDAFLNVSGINLLSDAIKDKVEINAVEPTITFESGDTLASHITTSITDVAYSPIFKYGVGYDPTTGNFTFSRPSTSDYKNLNPAVMVAPVAAQAGGYMTMLDTYGNAFANMDMRMLSPSSMRLSNRDANKYAITELSASENQFRATEYNSGGMYVRPYASFDSVGMKNGPKVNNMAYGSFIGGDSSIHQFQNGFEGVFSPYVAYQGSYQNFAGNSVYQNGGTLGFTGSLYKGKFFTGLTAGIGVNLSEANTMFGQEDFPMLMTGVANKTGYNFEFKDGRFIIQPSLQLSYTFVNTFNYKNAAGVRMDADPLHAFQIAPAVKFVMNTESGWQPYASFGMMWNITDDTQFTANNVSLPELSIKPYFQYGLGVQKLIGDRFTAYGQVMLRNGGRNGIAATFGGKYMLGNESRMKENI